MRFFTKDLVITGGWNVYPKEIEAGTEPLDGVAESVVSGVPHPDFDEAVVSRKPAVEHLTENAFLASLKEVLANYKVPKRVFCGRVAPQRDGQSAKESPALPARIPESLLACPEAGAALAGLRQLVERGWVGREERVVLFNTGSALKYLDVLDHEASASGSR